MSNKKRKPSQRRPSSSYRAPVKVESERPRGFLERFAPRPAGTSPMPKIRTSFARGLATVLATPVLVASIPVVLLVEWITLLAFGVQGPFAWLATTFGVPPIPTYVDTTLASSVFSQVGRSGVGAGLIPLVAITAFLLVTAGLQAAVTTVAVERLRTGSASVWAARRALHVLPVTVGVAVANLGVLIVSQFASLFGPGIGLLVFMGVLVGGVYLLAFAPAIAADEDHPFAVTMAKAVRAARMPGSNNILLATLYVVPSIATISAIGFTTLPGSTIDVNPSVGAWAAVILLNLLQMAVVATFAFRYLSVADVVPDAPARRERTRR
jgi:hypothetical protein